MNDADLEGKGKVGGPVRSFKSDGCKNGKRKAFYEHPDFEERVEKMPENAKAHMEALLRKVKPKNVKTLEQQMEEYLQREMEFSEGQKPIPKSDINKETTMKKDVKDVHLLTPHKRDKTNKHEKYD